MSKFEIVFNNEKDLTEKEVYKLIPENIQDSILCIRDHEGNSTILKGNITITLKRTEGEYLY